MKKIDRTNEVNTSNEGYLMKIVEYNNANDMIIEFQDEYKTKIKCAYKEFKNGEIKNPYHPNVCNVGYIGVGKYETKINGKRLKVYDEWKDMLVRCYSEKCHKKYPTYINCEVCKEWLCFQNYAKWREDNYYEVYDEKMCLDKDILKKGNKIYSPKTCIFVPHRINVLFTKGQKSRGKYPIGVTEKGDGTKLIARCNIFIENKSKKQHLGCFLLDEPFKAFTAYKNFKESYIKKVADEYKDLIPKKLYDAMYSYEVEIND